MSPPSPQSSRVRATKLRDPRGAVGQGKLDRPIQILDDIAEPAGDLKDNYLAMGTCLDLDQQIGWLHYGELDSMVPDEGHGPPRFRSSTRRSWRHHGPGGRQTPDIIPKTPRGTARAEPDS